MSATLPRTWKDFDSRWSRASKVEKFIIVSIFLHILIGVCWLIPRHFEELRKQELLTKQKEAEKKQQEEMEEEIAKLEEEAEEQEKEELAETQLKELFDELTEELLTEEEQQEEWEELKNDLAEELEELAELIADEEHDTLDAEEKVEEIKAEMISELYENIAEKTQESWKEKYLKALEKMAEQLAKEMKKELDKQISQPMAKETDNIFKKEVEKVKKEINAAKKQMREVRDHANKAEHALKKVADKIETEEANEKKADAQLTKKADDKSAAAAKKKATREIRKQAPKLANEQKQLKKPEATMRKAAETMVDIAPKVAEDILQMKKEHLDSAKAKMKKAEDAAQKHGDEKAEEKKPKSAAATETAAARDEMQKLKKRAEQAEKKLAGIDANKVVRERLRKLAAEMEKKELKKDFREAFDKAYKETAFKPMVDKLEKQFQEEAVKKGLTPPVMSLEKELKEILGKKFLDKIEAGKTSTKRLKAEQQLEKQKEPAEKGEMEKAAADKIRKTAKAISDRGMKKIAASLIGKAKADAKELESDKSLDDKAALLDKLGNMKNQIQKQRTSMLGTANLAGLAAIKRKTQSRRQAMGTPTERNKYILRDKLAYQAMIDKMKDRQKSSGAILRRKGTERETAKTESVFKPGLVLAAAIESDKKEPAKKKREFKKPAFKFNRFTGVPYVNHPITIDGKLDDWKDIPSQKLSWLYHGGDSNTRFRIAYSSKGIFLAVEALIDASPGVQDGISVREFWKNDCSEIFIDARNTKFRRRGEAHTKQFFVFPLGHKTQRDIGGYEAVFKAKGKRADWNRTDRHPRNVFPRAGRKTAKGWIVEFMIPKTLLTDSRLEPGRIIGFTISCNMGGNKYSYWAWTKGLQPSTNPHSWGDIQFLGSDATIAVMETTGKKESREEAVTAGEPLRIRIADGDMNLNDAVKDKVTVTASAASGDFVDMVLEETENSSGIFIGSVTTRPNIGVHNPEILDIHEGEEIKLTYIDQAQAYGETNVRVVAKVRVRSSGAKFIASATR